jgi:starch synthase
MKIAAVMRDLYSGSRLQKIVPYFEPWGRVSYVTVGLPLGQRIYNRVRTVRPSRRHWATRTKMNPYYFRAMSTTVAHSIREQAGNDVDVVLMFESLYSPGLGGKRTLPYVIYEDCTTAAASEGWPDWVPTSARTTEYHRLLVDYYHAAARILTSNELTRSSLINDYGIAPTQVIYVGQGCDWGKGVDRRSPAVDGRILFVGLDFERKGGKTLLEAFREVKKHVPHATLNLVGPNVTVADPGVSVIRPGHGKEVMRQFYEEASVFVLPSLFDPMPNAAMEAMAFGIPTVVADGCGTVEIVADGKDALVVPAGDAVVLAERLTRLLLEPDYRDGIGKAGAETIKRLSWESVAENARTILEDVVSEFSLQHRQPGARRSRSETYTQ